MKPILISCLLLTIAAATFGQRFGGTPPGVKWKQIDTDTARIIFPQGLDSQAARVASLVHYDAALRQAALGNRVKKIDIVLQNQTTIANGYVGVGPYRSEFYLTPSLNNFNLGSLPWSDQLAIHEYRHVEQYNNFRNGLSKLMSVLFGQEGYALAINASVPDWFYEGDAVYSETVLSKQGRGRLPQFMNTYPALWNADKQYSWMKLRNGSLKDYVPNHYNLGYLLVNYGYERYGHDFWAKVTRDASAFKGLFYPFQHAIKEHAGLNYADFVKEAFAYYQSQYVKSNANEAGPAPVLPLDKKVLTNNIFPYTMEDGSLLYTKLRNNRRPSFYVKDETGERALRVRDISIDQQFSYRNGKVVYAGYENDKRWRWRDYSVIKVMDVDSRRVRTITHKTKYFTPDISASGEKIVAVEAAIDGRSELHVLDAATGEVKTRIGAADVVLFTDPKFIGEDSVVTAVRLRDGRMALALAHISSGSTVRITPPSFNLVGFPSVSEGKIYFTASYGANDNLFMLDLANKKIYRSSITWPLGNYHVNVAGGKMSWSAFTADGYQLQQVEMSSVQWEPLDEPLAEMLFSPFPVGNEKSFTRVVGGDLPPREFPVSKYKKGTRLFNFHSWRPYYEDPEFTFSLYGDNVLNTLQSEIYYLHNQNDNTNAVGVNLLFSQWFPYLTAGTQYTFDRWARSGNRVKEWSQLDSRIGFSIPLSWASGQTHKQLNFGSNYAYRSDFNKGIYKDTFTTVRFSYLHHFISWAQQVEMAPQHIFPRLGYVMRGEYRDVINKYDSWQVLANGSVYLPGFFATHSIVASAGFQETDTMYAVFGNRLAYARGYNEAYFARMWRLSANYHFPILYPDWGFGNILYLKRVRGNAFYDLTRVYSNDKRASADQRSVGGELYLDTKWWNQYELSFGFRCSYLLDRDFYTGQSRTTVFEFVLPVSIIPR